jgi:phosphoribosylanthranilate isomerase
MTSIKICGLSEVDQALAAADSGADYIGLVFAPSHRQVTQEKAIRIVRSLNSYKYRLSVVGVFVNLPAQEVNSISDRCGLDLVQLSGDETLDYCRNMRLPVIKVIHISTTSSTQDVIRKIQEGNRLLSGKRILYLLDSRNKAVYGGTGQIFGWQLAKDVSIIHPVIVAGGLTPENVGQLIEEAKPWGVDVSSGIETNNLKDICKIRDFIKTVKSYSKGK